MKRKSTLKKIIKRTKRVNDKKAKLNGGVLRKQNIPNRHGGYSRDAAYAKHAILNEVIKAQEEAKKASKKAQKLYEKYISLY